MLPIQNQLWRSKFKSDFFMKQTTKLRIAGMTCPNCAVHIEKALEAVPGVNSAKVELEKGAAVEHSGASTADLLTAVLAAGNYKAEVIS